MKKYVRKIVALMLTFAMVFASIQINSNKAKAEETDVIEISSAEELAKIGNDENYPMDGKYKLTADITDVATTIGDSSTTFTGEFDGDDHSVTFNLSSEVNYNGLFAYIKGASVQNVVVKGTMNVQYGWTAGIAAKAEDSTITNCGSEVNIHSDGTNSTCFAGIAGYAKNTTITGCYNTGNIDGIIKNAAGIAGQTNTSVDIENCYNTGSITTTATSAQRVGGIAGYGAVSSGQVGKIYNCYNSGVIEGSGQVGTFMGYIYTGFDAKNCFYLEETHENSIGFIYEGVDVSDVKIVTQEELKELVETLGDAFTKDSTINNGYPILKWQVNTDQEDKALLDSLVSELPSGVISPQFNEDKNLNTYVSNLIESKEDYAGKGITVSIKSVENRFSDENTYIEDDGTIDYFYTDLFEEGFAYRYYGQADIIFELKLNNVTVEYAPRCVNIYWDINKVLNDLNTISDGYINEQILGENESLESVTDTLKLPVYPNINYNDTEKNIKWVSTKYTSSDSSVVAIADNASWDSDFTNMFYDATVYRNSEDKEVTITAEFTFERYTMNSGEDTVTETVKREIPVKVLAYNEVLEQSKALQEKLATYAEQLTDFNVGGEIDINNVKNDIQLVIPKNLGLDGKYYEISVESSDSSVMEVCGYRTYTYRPLPGEASKEVTLTVTVTNKENPTITASTKVTLTVIPMTEQEIDDALLFMNQAKNELFHLIKNENEDNMNVTTDLYPFYGIYQNEERKVYAASYVDKPDNNGIIKKIVNPDEEIPDNQRYWISSDNAVIEDQSLRVTVPKYDTKVTVGVILSHEIYENYARRYGDDPVYGEIFNQLSQQYVSVEVVVKGTDGEEPTSDFETVTNDNNETTSVNDETTTKENVENTTANTETTTVNNETTQPDNIIKNDSLQKLKVKSFKVKKKKKSIKITWKNNKYVDGYKIRYSKNKNLKKAKTVFVKAGKKTKNIKNLKSNKYYYVKMRAYRIVNKKRVYGKWTKVKKVKTK